LTLWVGSEQKQPRMAMIALLSTGRAVGSVHGRETVTVNSLTAIRFWRVLAGSKNSCPVGFVRRNSTKSTVISNTTINKHHHHGGAVCPSYGVGSMDPPNLRQVTSSKGVGQGRFRGV